MTVSRAARFRKADVERAVKGVVSAGVSVGRIEIEPSGNIVIFPAEAQPRNGRVNSWDDVLK